LTVDPDGGTTGAGVTSSACTGKIDSKKKTDFFMTRAYPIFL
jgi:hypothetical protein